MRNLILLLRKFGALFLFLFLEFIAFFLIVNYNNKQREIFLYSSNLFSGKIMERYDASMDYFSLSAINDSIAAENARLLGLVLNKEKPEIFHPLPQDTSFQHFKIIPAQIANMSIKYRNNRFTIDKGTSDGIRAGMGVLSENGIIGVVHKVNSRFASIMPIINTQLQVSAKVKTKNFFGDLVWQPYDERKMHLRHIPKHANVAVGDTIVTSGFSTVFPADIPIGTIEKILLPSGSNYFDITVSLFNTIAKLEYVYIVDNKLSEFQKEIEE